MNRFFVKFQIAQEEGRLAEQQDFTFRRLLRDDVPFDVADEIAETGQSKTFSISKKKFIQSHSKFVEEANARIYRLRQKLKDFDEKGCDAR